MEKGKVNIIGISGKHGSGKDTVGTIIQMVPFMSDDEIFRALDDVLLVKNMQKTSLWEIKKFAGKLKEIASLLTGIPLEKFENQEFKETRLGPEWFECKPYIAGVTDVCHPMKVRTFLQKLGTDAMRNGLHENVWVNALMSDCDDTCKWLVTDVRFKNEAAVLRNAKAILLRVNRNIETGSHPSEVDLDDYDFDYVIDNTKDLMSLIKAVRKFCSIYKID
jgi:hypothetical protein